ncbi:MAG: YbgC/FadM family acyl-CoA thioesterase [Elusimicrobiales bacterium]|nr:YbgC/FadM family acyl-CoA thioesterase [Elusimicrobiales bacterium]
MKKRIFYHDTDCGGVVYHGNYLKYFEEVRTEFLEKLGYSVKAFMDMGIYFVVRSQSAEYLKPAFYDDTLEVKTRLSACTPVRMTFAYEIRNQNGVLLTTGQTMLVSVGTDMKVKPLQHDMLEKFKAAISDSF